MGAGSRRLFSSTALRGRRLLLVLLIIAVGALLRVPYIVYYPVFYHDETDWVGPGLNMVLYGRGYVEFNGYYFLPHHPPLTCIPFGVWWALVYPDIAMLRAMLVVQYVIVSLILYLVARRAFGWLYAAAILFVYSVAPLYVNLSMTITPEGGVSVLSVVLAYIIGRGALGLDKRGWPWVLGGLLYIWFSDYVYPSVLVAAMIVSYLFVYRRMPRLNAYLLLLAIAVGGVLSQYAVYTYVFTSKTDTLRSILYTSGGYTRYYIEGLMGRPALLRRALYITMSQLAIVASTLPLAALPIIVLARRLRDRRGGGLDEVFLSLTIILYTLAFISLPRARYVGPALALAPLLLDRDALGHGIPYRMRRIYLYAAAYLVFSSILVYGYLLRYYYYYASPAGSAAYMGLSMLIIPAALLFYLFYLYVIGKRIDSETVAAAMMVSLIASSIILNPILIGFRFIEDKIPEHGLAGAVEAIMDSVPRNESFILISYKDTAYTLYVHGYKSFIYGGTRIAYYRWVGYKGNVFLENVSRTCGSLEPGELSTTRQLSCILGYVASRNLSAIAVDYYSSRSLYEGYGFRLYGRYGRYAVYYRGLELGRGG